MYYAILMRPDFRNILEGKVRPRICSNDNMYTHQSTDRANVHKTALFSKFECLSQAAIIYSGQEKTAELHHRSWCY